MSVIILEGPDCSGKTTLAKKLIKWFGGCMLHGVKFPEDNLPQYHEAMAKDAVANHELGHNVLIDRLWPSAGVYNGNWKSKTLVEDVFRDAKIKPVYIFCLTDKCIELHKEQRDPQHAYTDDEHERLYREYKGLYLAMKDNPKYRVLLFDFTLHGKDRTNSSAFFDAVGELIDE